MRLSSFIFLLFLSILGSNAQSPYYRVDDPESKTCFFIDTLGKELPIGKHNKLRIAEKFSEGLICINFKKHDWEPNSWGCLNANGDTIIRGKYLEQFTFYNGVAKVAVAAMPTLISNDGDEVEYYCQYIDSKGNLINEKLFESSHSTVMDHTWAVAKADNKWFIISKAGKLKTLSVDYEWVEGLSDGLAKCKRKNTYTVYVDTTSWPVINISNENYTGTFINGYASYSIVEHKYGFIDKKGKPLCPCLYDAVSFFSENMAAVKIYDKWGFVDPKGKMVINPMYDNSSAFKEGMAVIAVNGKYGFIDKTGKTVIPIKFMNAMSFEKGRAAVSDEKNNWGYINKKGDWIIEPQFLSAENFDENGFALVTYTDKHSYKKDKLLTYEKALISRNGKVVWYSGEKLIIK